MKLFVKKEKKVEYLELIYDLIFVYMIGKSNALIHNFEDGFVTPAAFFTYTICTLAIIQIWNFTTFYINNFGHNSARDHIFMFINMYLLYFVGQSTRADWQNYQIQYHIAWGLILVNIGVQYFIELRSHSRDSKNRSLIIRMGVTLLAEAAIVFTAAFTSQGVSMALSFCAVAAGIILTVLTRRKSADGHTDFNHLTERAMLFVVFTFGEMIIALASYFNGDGSVTLNTVYFSLAAFLIVVGLFLSYGLMYDHLIDRDGDYDGILYMALHVFIIFFLNNITASLEFMREEEVSVLPKMIFLIISIVGFFSFLFALTHYVKGCNRPSKRFVMIMTAITVVFAAVMILFRENMKVNILITVIYVFSMFLTLFISSRKIREKHNG